MAKLISVETALEKIMHSARPVDTETCALENASGRVLAQDVNAKTTLPPLSVSAMDGYAVCAEQPLESGTRLKIIGASPAGNPFQGTVKPGECVRIYTGGAVPNGAGRVVIQENTRADKGEIILTQPPSPALHIRAAGIDFFKGDPIARAGTRLDPFSIAKIAAANIAHVLVYRRPRVAIIANGDELVRPGSELKPGHIINSNAYGLAPLIKEWGGEAIDGGISKDDPAAIRAQIQGVFPADMLLPVGGASVGDRDYMRAVFSALGYEKIFEKVAVKPGKPVWFGHLQTSLVLGLPGNPASALVCAHLFLKPLLYAMCNTDAQPNPVHVARTTVDLKAPGWRTNYMRAQTHIDAEGQLLVTPNPSQDSSLLSPFQNNNCFIRQMANSGDVARGDKVEILPFKAM